jgi:tetratricopeptide (TPR) repeat protein
MTNAGNDIKKHITKNNPENHEDTKLKTYEQALKLTPNDPIIYNNFGIYLIHLRKFQKAIKCFNKAIHINPNFETAHNNLGNVFQELDRYQEAVSCYQKAINIKPHFAEAHYNLGNVLNKIGKTRNAILNYKKALKHNPRYNSARYNLARAQLAIDDFENGWKGFELRDGNTKKFYEKLGITKEQVWNGSKFNGSLLIHADQGIGDEILYSSIFSELVNYHKDLIISADERLINLFEKSFPKIKFISRKKTKIISKIRKINAMKNSRQLLAGSLGKYFRNSLEDFKHNQYPWLVPNIHRVEEFKKYFSVLEKIKVGLSWKSTAKNYKDKNISLTDLAKIFPADYFEIINLQYGDIKSDKIKFEEKTKRKLIHFDNFDYTNDLEGLAALICNCDLVASISNATVHLAGALGKHTWILIPTNAQWYWHSSRNKSLWYPNIRLFRQKNKGDWNDVFNHVKVEVFSKFIKNKKTK